MKPAGLQLNDRMISVRGSIMLTSFSDFASGLLSDYSRANCTRGATADNVMAGIMKEGL